MDKLLENTDSKGAAKEFPQESTNLEAGKKTTQNQMFILYLHRKWYRLNYVKGHTGALRQPHQDWNYSWARVCSQGSCPRREGPAPGASGSLSLRAR